jgi:uncharacterized protein
LRNRYSYFGAQAKACSYHTSYGSSMTTKTISGWVLNARVREATTHAAIDLGFEVDWVNLSPTPTQTITTDYLVARQPWLVLVELNPAHDWLSVVTIAKTSPATRKLPILAIGDVSDAEAQRARHAGCEAVVPMSAFVACAASFIQQHAKADDSAELAKQALLPLPQLAHTAIEQFNQKEFFEQHELFEALWRAEPGPVRQMYQGILQVGVAYLQIQRKNYTGARKLFQRAWQYLSVLPDVCQGVDIAQLKDDAQAAQAELERLGPQRIGEFPEVLFKPVRMKDSA